MLNRSRNSTRGAVALVAVVLAVATFAASPPLRAAASAQPGGVTLDGWGGLHPFGGAVINQTGSPYWRGWDIARAISVLPDGGGGWTLDGWGGIHNWGAAPVLPTAAYWRGWDIARALVVTPNQSGGYVLDGWGGIHPLGTAPALPGAPYWRGWDIARGLDIHYDAGGTPDGGWVLDAWGGIHAFGAAPTPTTRPTYYSGFDVWQKVHVTAGRAAYYVGRFGVTTLDSTISPYWTGYLDWGNWDILRDIALLDTTNPTPQTQPVTTAASSAFVAAHTAYAGILSRPACGHLGLVRPGKWITISLACQELSAYDNGHLVYDTYVTTGEPALPTPTGHYSVLRKSHPFEMISSWPYGTIGWYPPSWVNYVLWFRSDGYGIHDAPWRTAYGPGTELHGSHGCVNVPFAPEQALYSWAPVGTPVDVY